MKSTRLHRKSLFNSTLGHIVIIVVLLILIFILHQSTNVQIVQAMAMMVIHMVVLGISLGLL